MIARLFESWPFAIGVTAAVHLALLPVPLRARDETAELEHVAFELAELPAATARPAPPPEPPGPAAAAPSALHPTSNRPPARTSTATADEPPPLRTGAPLTSDQLAPSGVGVAVRVGNTWQDGHDADVSPDELQGFASEPARADAAPERPRRKARSEMRPPELLRAAEPAYPEHLWSTGIEGSVTLEVVVGANGRVSSAKVVTGVHPELDASAVAGLERFRWDPARRDGVAVEATIRLTIVFTRQRSSSGRRLPGG